MFVAANWKMNLDKKSILEFTKSLHKFKFSNEINTCIFPPMTYIDYLYNLIKTYLYLLVDRIVISNLPERSLEKFLQIFLKIRVVNMC